MESIAFISDFMATILSYHILKCAQTMHVDTTSPLSKTVSMMYILLVPHFLAIYTSVTILGNAHRPCKNASTLSKRVYIMSILFLLIVPDFLIIFA